jgi:hypothetical protein
VPILDFIKNDKVIYYSKPSSLIDCIVLKSHEAIKREINMLTFRYLSLMCEHENFPTEYRILTDNKFQIPQRLWFIAHGDIANYQFIGYHKLVNQDYYKPNNEKYDFAIVFACSGSEILSSPNWKPVCEQWVSFDKNIHVNLLTPLVYDAWINIWKKSMKILKKSLTSKSAKEELRNVFSREIDNLKKNSGPYEGNIAITGYLAIAKDALKCNADYE